jgi:hypothetical protein
MYSVEVDDINRLIKVNWSENVSADEMRECAEQLRALTANIKPGFRLLSDLTGLKSMDHTAASYIGAIMDLFAAKKVSLIVRVIPDPHSSSFVEVHALSAGWPGNPGSDGASPYQLERRSMPRSGPFRLRVLFERRINPEAEPPRFFCETR